MHGAEQGRRTERSSQGGGGEARGGRGSEGRMGCVPGALEPNEKPLLSLAIWRFLATHERLLGVGEGHGRPGRRGGHSASWVGGAGAGGKRLREGL